MMTTCMCVYEAYNTIYWTLQTMFVWCETWT